MSGNNIQDLLVRTGVGMILDPVTPSFDVFCVLSVITSRHNGGICCVQVVVGDWVFASKHDNKPLTVQFERFTPSILP